MYFQATSKCEDFEVTLLDRFAENTSLTSVNVFGFGFYCRIAGAFASCV